jgi:hypothetical protein
MGTQFYRKSIVFVVVLTMLTPQQLLAQSRISDAERPLGPEINGLKAELEIAPSHLKYAKYKMLKSKKESELDTTIRTYDYSISPRGASPLSREYTGLNLTSSGLLYSRGLSSSMDLITGERAINESLQLGSIGQNRAGNMTWRQQQIFGTLRIQLELYYEKNGSTYPNSLSELDVDATQQELAQFSYRRVGSEYELTLGSLVSGPVNIDDVEGLTIEHHPWEEMIGNANPTIPAIYSLIPQDYFFVHFNDLERMRELEETLAELQGPLKQVYSIGEALSTKQKIFNRLGVVDNPKLDTFLNEIALISYDFDGYPGTDYALILDIVSNKLEGFVDDHIDAPEERKGLVGDYYVVATSKELFEHIEDTQSGAVSNMASALDLKYSLSVLEPDMDGFVFISDALVEKLTSPEYRINARRRNTVLSALETLQYASFAYRDITGAWPKSVEQMMNERYLKPGSVYELSKYSIDSDGVVSHSDWGSIYEVKPISQVEIKTVMPAEKDLYDRFREGYQEFWREFIDPVAISILIGDQIRFHTIILPLIDESQYNWVKNIVGKGNGSLDFVIDPDRVPAIQLTSRFDINSVLYGVYQTFPGQYDQAYVTCRTNYYNKRDYTKPLREACLVSELPEEEAILAVKKKIAEIIDWENDSARLFTFMGDELSFAASENATFLIEDLSKFDFHIGVEFSDAKEGKEFIEHVISWVAEDLFGGESMSMGMFGLSAGKPIRNEYNGVEYFMIPTGFINLFYIFIDDRMYITISQLAINALIDGQTEEWGAHMKRLQDYLGSNQDVSLLLDGRKLQTWLESYAKEQIFSYSASIDFENLRNYINETLYFEENVIGQSGGAERYYSMQPSEWLGIEIDTNSREAVLKTGQADIALNNVQAINYWFDDSLDATSGNTVEFTDLVEMIDVNELISEWSGVDTFGANLSMTEDGLDVRIVFNNHARDRLDERVGSFSRKASKDAMNFTGGPMYLLIGGALAFIFLIAIVVILRKRRGPSVQDVVAQETVEEMRVNEDPALEVTSAGETTQEEPFVQEDIPAAQTNEYAELIAPAVSYVNTARGLGKSDEEIRQNLLSNGWSEADVQYALQEGDVS